MAEEADRPVRPKIFRTKKFDPKHLAVLNRSIRHNFRGKDHHVSFNYTKEDGTKEKKVVRALWPKRSKAGDHILVGKYEGGSEYRSFRLDRMKHVKEASMFWQGFEKRAFEFNTISTHVPELGGQFSVAQRRHPVQTVPVALKDDPAATAEYAKDIVRQKTTGGASAGALLGIGAGIALSNILQHSGKLRLATPAIAALLGGTIGAIDGLVEGKKDARLSKEYGIGLLEYKNRADRVESELKYKKLKDTNAQEKHAGFVNKASKFISNHPNTMYLGGVGAMAGGRIGYEVGASDVKHKGVLKPMLLGATIGGATGAAFGYNFDRMYNDMHGAFHGSNSEWDGYKHRYKDYFGGRAARAGMTSDSALSVLGMTRQSAKSKKEVVAMWRKLALQHHPDRGGNIETMKKLNEAMDFIKKSSWFENLPD